ncbi:TRAP transporter small permease subunit [Methylophaga lonarensis]|nr:TRAP transporter small permease subunit [Methylophaga lonarensis]
MSDFIRLSLELAGGLWDTCPSCATDSLTMNKQLEFLKHRIDALTEFSGKTVSWLVLALVLLIVYDVTMRYWFQSGSVALQELEWHLFALLFLLGMAYTHKHDGHVRVDIVFRSRLLNDRQRAWINVLGTVLFLMPFCLMVLFTSWPFVYNSWLFSETSPDPGGLPHRFLIKSALLVGFGLLLLQGIAEFIRNLQIVLDKQEAR